MLNWYLQNGKESDVVISSRIRLARNLRDFPFEPKMKKEEQQALVEKLKEVMPSLGYGLKIWKLKDMDTITKLSLVEKRIISPDFLNKEETESAIAINEEENICFMINEEDHLRMQFFAPGFDLENLLNLAIEVEEKLGKLVSFAYHKDYGFLTACPTNVGTAMRASVMVHLPGLSQTGNIRKILEVINNFGMNIRGIYGEGSKTVGDMYQISNKQTLGITETEILKNLKIITEKIVEQERLARKYLGKDTITLEDKVYRAYGILSQCRKISSSELNELLSEIKMGTDLGIIKELTDLKVKKLNILTKPASLQKYFGKEMAGEERDQKRAELIQLILKEQE